MDFIKYLTTLFLAIVPAHQYLNLILLVPVTALTSEFAKALGSLGTGFVRERTLITLGMLATGAGHATYAVWAHSGEAPLTLGILVLAGYILASIGLARAFIQEQGTAH